MKNYKIYSPSYRRAHIAISHKLFLPNTFCYVVRDEEADLYRINFPTTEIITIPKGLVSNISNTRNWILENKTSDYVVMVDDDMKAIEWNLFRKFKKLSAEHIDYMIKNMFLLAEESGCGIWGINLLRDPKAYRPHTPFSFGNPILGPFTGVLDCELKYDEVLSLKEDYDFSLQQIAKHRRALRVNFLTYLVDHQKLEGGCQTYRTKEREIEQNLLLQKKWGSKVVKKNKNNPGSINPVVKTGL